MTENKYDGCRDTVPNKDTCTGVKNLKVILEIFRKRL
jgi:hypothetical protein